MDSLEANSTKQIKVAAIISYILVAFNIIVGLVYTPWLINSIGKSDYALYALSTSIMAFVFLNFGVGSAISKSIAKYTVVGNKQAISNLLGVSLKIYFVLTSVIAAVLIILWLFIDVIYVGLTPTELNKFKIVFLITAVFSVLSFPLTPINDILIGNGRFIILRVCDLGNRVLTIGAIVIALSLGYGLYALVTLQSIIGLLINLYKIILVKKKIGLEINFKYKDSALLRYIFFFSLWITIATIADRLILNITPTILGMVSNSTQITMFSVAMTFEGMIWTLAFALSGLFLPKVTNIVELSEDSETELSNLMIKVGRFQLSILGLVVIGFIIMGQEFIPLWIGEGFEEVYWATVLLIIPCLLIMTQDIARTIIIVKDKVKYRAMVFIFSAVLSLTLSYILSPKYGAIGAAMGVFCANILGKVFVMNFMYKGQLKLDVIRFYKECYLKMSIPFIILIVLGLMVQSLFPTESMVIFGVKALLISTVYAVCMWVWGYNNEEKRILQSLLPGMRG